MTSLSVLGLAQPISAQLAGLLSTMKGQPKPKKQHKLVKPKPTQSKDNLNIVHVYSTVNSVINFSAWLVATQVKRL
jgi:hypothetical protein